MSLARLTLGGTFRKDGKEVYEINAESDAPDGIDLRESFIKMIQGLAKGMEKEMLQEKIDRRKGKYKLVFLSHSETALYVGTERECRVELLKWYGDTLINNSVTIMARQIT